MFGHYEEEEEEEEKEKEEKGRTEEVGGEVRSWSDQAGSSRFISTNGSVEQTAKKGEKAKKSFHLFDLL